MKSILNVGVIGCGSIFNNHVQAIRNIENVKLIAICDIKREIAIKKAEENQCNFYTDYEEMFQNEALDAVHICLPHYLHGDIAIRAMRHGIHVLVEKPMDITLEKCYMMIEEQNKNNRHLTICFQNRFNDTSIKIKEYIDNGYLGNLKAIKAFVTWNRDEGYYKSSPWRGKFLTEGGGILINQAIHTLDLLQWFGGDIDWIKGNVDTRLLDEVIEVEDTADGTMKFKNGALGIFYFTNCYSTNSPVEIELLFEKGFLKLIDGKLWMVTEQKNEVICKDFADPFKEKGYWGHSHEKLISNFYDNIFNENDDEISGSEGLKVIKVIDGIYKSSALGKRIFL